MGKISREDMLELTRRMTVKRNCFSRIAGAYIDTDGEIDGTFHTHFLKLSEGERKKYLDFAKVIPFAKENTELKNYPFKLEDERPNSMWQMLMALKDCELKNDALLDIFYEKVAQSYHSNTPYAVYFYHGTYDVPLKANDKESLWESEEVYKFILCIIASTDGDYELTEVKDGFLFPAFLDRSSDIHGINIYESEADIQNRNVLNQIVFS